MAKQDGRGSLSAKSEPVLYLPPGQRAYEQCRVLKDHLGQLVKAGHLKELGNRGPGLGAQQRGNPAPPPLGIIEVIHAVPGSKNMLKTRVSTVASRGDFSKDQPPTKRTKGRLDPIAFDDEDLEGTI